MKSVMLLQQVDRGLHLQRLPPRNRDMIEIGYAITDMDVANDFMLKVCRRLDALVEEIRRDGNIS